ncbi:hypothetical protein ACIRBX_33775 [Kitasatospora sp. NPDC096147]|uniref:hypothetical protein n=1 Tax=Kitasatospora sp. NPDC096147 TaxID=3364093 RepID=UPI00380CE21A
MGENEPTGAVARWVPVVLPADGWGRRPWAVWDQVTDLWVASGDGEIELYFDRIAAQGCIRRLRYLNEAGLHHS